MSVNIHGKEYHTVAERLAEAKAEIESINTEVIAHEPTVVIKATVKMISGKIFTGISGANVQKSIEKASPYEVAETSAVGRALGFAGYGATESIASADEMAKVDPTDNWKSEAEEANTKADLNKTLGLCAKCGAPNTIYKTSGKVGCSKLCWKNK